MKGSKIFAGSPCAERTSDPVCFMSLHAYWDAYKNGGDELSSKLAAVEAFFHIFDKDSNIPVNSPCAAATRALYSNISSHPSGPNKVSMEVHHLHFCRRPS